LIDELVYERVRLDADLVAMRDLERELATSLRRALAESRGDPTETSALLDRAVERAFVRVTDELVEAAARDVAGECPLCDRPIVAGADSRAGGADPRGCGPA
jgi:hypothetical protein